METLKFEISIKRSSN